MRSLIIGASGGIGAALVKALASKGEVVALSRATHGLEITDEASVAEHLGALAGSFDLIFTATGALGTPEKALRSLTAGELLSQMAINALGPALILKHALRLMPKDRRCVFAALSARVGSIGDNSLGGWHSYRASKAALNQLLHGAAIEIARSHPQAIVAALHPGTVATPFTEGYGHDKHSPARAAADLLAVLDGLTPQQSGGFFDYSGATVQW